MLPEKRRLIYAAVISNYIVLVLLIFQPFGINNYHHHFDIDLIFFAVMLLFDAVTFLVLFTLSYLYKILFRKNEKAWKELVVDWFFLASIFFYLYNILGNWHDYYLTSYVEFLYSSLMLLIFPYSVLLFLDYQNKKNTRLIKFKNSAGKIDLLVDPSLVLFIKSDDNYINVHYLKNNVVQKKLIRNTLAETKKNLPLQFVRCHRSYIINIQIIQSLFFEGKRSELKMKYWDDLIPVSPTEKETLLFRHV